MPKLILMNIGPLTLAERGEIKAAAAGRQVAVGAVGRGLLLAWARGEARAVTPEMVERAAERIGSLTINEMLVEDMSSSTWRTIARAALEAGLKEQDE